MTRLHRFPLTCCSRTAHNGHLNVVEYLLASGAAIEAKDLVSRDDGEHGPGLDMCLRHGGRHRVCSGWDGGREDAACAGSSWDVWHRASMAGLAVPCLQGVAMRGRGRRTHSDVRV